MRENYLPELLIERAKVADLERQLAEAQQRIAELEGASLPPKFVGFSRVLKATEQRGVQLWRELETWLDGCQEAEFLWGDAESRETEALFNRWLKVSLGDWKRLEQDTKAWLASLPAAQETRGE